MLTSFNLFKKEIAANTNSKHAQQMFNFQTFMKQCSSLQEILGDLESLLDSKDVKMSKKSQEVQNAFDKLNQILLTYDENIIPFFMVLKNLYSLMDKISEDLSEIFHKV